jgi:hypothetical protein
LAAGSYTILYEFADANCPRKIEVTLRIDNDCVVNPCETLIVKNGISVNNDGDNEFLYIEGIESDCYMNNTVEIYNRWGVKVFETENYDNVTNVFRGQSQGRSTIKASEELPTGTYFYIITFRSELETIEPKQGYLYLTR